LIVVSGQELILIKKSEYENSYCIDNVRNDWRILDCELFPEIGRVNLVSHESFTASDELAVHYIPPGLFADLFSHVRVLHSLIYAIRLFRGSDRSSVVIVNGGNTMLWVWCGLLNALKLLGRRKLLCWDLFVEYQLGQERRLWFFPFIKLTTKRKEKFARFIMRQYGLNVLWSRKQVGSHAKRFDLPDRHFIFIPFKANHSKNEPLHISIGDFIFSGGNGKRDYKCLIEAVRDTEIPVIISATDPRVRQGIEQIPNVIVLAAAEPAFAQLQAASRFVVIPMIYSGLKGGGEANFCNAMWHKKPVIASDSISAEDYILEGETGYVVPSGDYRKLRKRILTLWNDAALCKTMGEKAHEHVRMSFTHAHFIKRLVRLALLFANDKRCD
jgi:glycosyltransferase involved in cell wall biosynthesis